MRLSVRDGLPFASVTVGHGGKQITLPEVLVDTGSARTILSADAVASIGITPDPADILYVIRGVGGSEVVFCRQVDGLQIGERRLEGFEIEVGGMDYGFEIHGILGMDFLHRVGAILDLAEMSIKFTE